MTATYMPVTHADQWAVGLAKPGHWKTGYSAKSLAYCWQEADGFPPEVRTALQTSAEFAEIELLLALPEHKVDLPGGVRPSQNDIWLLARAGGDLVSITVEGKVAESFDRTVDEWLRDSSEGKSQRLAFLRNLLGLHDAPLGAIRYQLLHRTASALIEAKRFGASHAVMLVHSFSPTQAWFSDFAAFASLFGVAAEPGRTLSAGKRSGVELQLGWVCGDPAYLTK